MPATYGAGYANPFDAEPEDVSAGPIPFTRLVPKSQARRLLLFRAMVCAEVLAGIALFLVNAPHLGGDWHLFLILLALNLIAERSPISIYGDTVITIGFVFTMAIIALIGPAGVAIAAPLEVFVRRVGRRPLRDLIFIRGLFRGVVIHTLAAYAFLIFAPMRLDGLQWQIVPACLAGTAVAFGLSALLITISLSLRTNQPMAAVWANHRWLAPYYLAFGIVGVTLAGAYSGLGYWGIVSFLTPAFMMRFSMKLYVDKTAENVEKLKEQNAALERANVEIRKVSDELIVTYNSTLETLVNALEARDQETKGHSVRVARYMLNIAEALGVRPGSQDWQDMQHGALLHDVGKIGVRDAILLKPAKLTPEEWEHMRKHPEIGFNILKEVKFLHGAAEIVLAHHERWDGAGYPRGLKAEEIPLGSRIFAVVDTFDSMTWDRVYRKALSPEESLQEILRCSGSQFDPLVVEAFLDIYDAWVLEHQRLGLVSRRDVRNAA